MNHKPITITHLTNHKHRESRYLRAYKAHLYTCRELSTNRPFYAKQTQFPKKSNERKLLLYKVL
jgi:hypothetical protein